MLCLDGGGIRGLVLVQLLINLEAAVGKPIVHCFDWIAGTSTGGILALALASGKSLRECQRVYFRMKEHAFVGFRPYPSEPLENILKDILGKLLILYILNTNLLYYVNEPFWFRHVCSSVRPSAA